MKVKRYIIDMIFFISLALFFIFLTYHQVFCTTQTGKYASDTLQHIQFAKDFSTGKIYIPHPLWHLCVLYIGKLLNASIEYAAVICSTFFLMLWSGIVFYVVKTFLDFKYEIHHILVTLIILTIGPLNIPWYNPVIFFGQSSPNIWHNVTLWTVKPFALLSILFLFKALKIQKIRFYIFTAIFLLLSIFAKPSFIIIFLPALFIFMLFFKVYKNKPFVLFFVMVSLMALLLLYYQYTHTFTEKEGKIIFDFLGVWSLSSQNIPMSILLGLAFPIFLTLSESKILFDEYIAISWIETLIALVLYATLAQEGKYYGHGNFGWSYAIAMSILYLFTIIKFFEMYPTMNHIKRYALMALLLLQFLIGSYFLLQVAEGYRVLFISIRF